VFSIAQNWRARPLVSHEVVINWIANTTTETVLRIQAELDAGTYPIGIKVSDQEQAAVNLKTFEFPLPIECARSFAFKVY
jgi:hypothetical protein